MFSRKNLFKALLGIIVLFALGLAVAQPASAAPSVPNSVPTDIGYGANIMRSLIGPHDKYAHGEVHVLTRVMNYTPVQITVQVEIIVDGQSKVSRPKDIAPESDEIVNFKEWFPELPEAGNEIFVEYGIVDSGRPYERRQLTDYRDENITGGQISTYYESFPGCLVDGWAAIDPHLKWLTLSGQVIAQTPPDQPLAPNEKWSEQHGLLDVSDYIGSNGDYIVAIFSWPNREDAVDHIWVEPCETPLGSVSANKVDETGVAWDNEVTAELLKDGEVIDSGLMPITFDELSLGSYTIREVVPAGSTPIGPISYDFTLTDEELAFDFTFKNDRPDDEPNACSNMDMEVLEAAPGYRRIRLTVDAVINERTDGVVINFGDDSPITLIESQGPWTVEHEYRSTVSTTFNITATVIEDGEILEGICEAELQIMVTKDCDWWVWIQITWLDRERVAHEDSYGHAIVVQSSTCHIENGTEQEGLPLEIDMWLVNHDGQHDQLAFASARMLDHNQWGNMSINGNTAYSNHVGLGRYSKIHITFQVVPLNLNMYSADNPLVMDVYIRVKFTDPDGVTQEPYMNAKWLTVYPGNYDTLPEMPTIYWMGNTITVPAGASVESLAAACGMTPKAFRDVNHWWTTVAESDDMWFDDGQILACGWDGPVNGIIADRHESLEAFAARHGTTADYLIAVNGLQGRFQTEVFPGQVFSLYLNPDVR